MASSGNSFGVIPDSFSSWSTSEANMNNRKIPPIIGVKAKSKYQALLLLSSRHLIVKDKLGISFINEYKRYITQ